MRRAGPAAILIGTLLGLVSSGGAGERSDDPDRPGPEAPSTVGFVLSFQIDEDLWSATDWAEPPQLALWLEEESSGEIRTLFVTRRTASDRWEGQPAVPAALPYWITRYKREFGRDQGPTAREPLPDAVTGATPRGSFSHAFSVPPGTWSLFLEVNVSGDYNPHYRRVETDGSLEDFGNGQPSLVYRARDITREGELGLAVIGMTAPIRTPEEMLVEPRHITSADRLLQGISLTKAPPTP